ncbi:MAG: dephospho-CoA kinase [Bdellovibrionales bacterium]
MLWYGLTGGLGTGKSTVASLIRSHGIPVIDADRLAKEVVEKGSIGLERVRQAFGPDILNSQGELDRLKMAEIVFAKPDQLLKLESIIHPLVQEAVHQQKNWLKDQDCPWAVYDVPLLFEKKLKNQFDGIITVTADEQQQIDRVKKRNAWNDEEILKRIRVQVPLAVKVKESDYVINNQGSLTDLEKQVASLVQLLNDKI